MLCWACDSDHLLSVHPTVRQETETRALVKLNPLQIYNDAVQRQLGNKNARTKISMGSMVEKGQHKGSGLDSWK